MGSTLFVSLACLTILNGAACLDGDHGAFIRKTFKVLTETHMTQPLAVLPIELGEVARMAEQRCHRHSWFVYLLSCAGLVGMASQPQHIMRNAVMGCSVVPVLHQWQEHSHVVATKTLGLFRVATVNEGHVLGRCVAKSIPTQHIVGTFPMLTMSRSTQAQYYRGEINVFSADVWLRGSVVLSENVSVPVVVYNNGTVVL